MLKRTLSRLFVDVLLIFTLSFWAVGFTNFTASAYFPFNAEIVVNDYYYSPACQTAMESYLVCLEQIIESTDNSNSADTCKTNLSSALSSLPSSTSAQSNVKRQCTLDSYRAFGNGFPEYEDCLLEYLEDNSTYDIEGLTNCAIEAINAKDGATAFAHAQDPSSSEELERQAAIDSYYAPEGTAEWHHLCETLNDANAQGKCSACHASDGWWTAIGCIPAKPTDLVNSVITFLIGLAGLFMLGQILYGAFRLITSQGNPQATQDARERITNAVIALLFIILGVTVLRIIGVDIFQLPGFFDNAASV